MKWILERVMKKCYAVNNILFLSYHFTFSSILFRYLKFYSRFNIILGDIKSLKWSMPLVETWVFALPHEHIHNIWVIITSTGWKRALWEGNGAFWRIKKGNFSFSFSSSVKCWVVFRIYIFGNRLIFFVFMYSVKCIGVLWEWG